VLFSLFGRKESKIITKASMIRSFNQGFFYSLLSLLTFATLSTYTGLGNVLTPKKVFTVIGIFAVTRIYYFYTVVSCLLGLSDMWVASKRIQVRLVDVVYCTLPYNSQELLLVPELNTNKITYSDKTISRSCSPNVMPPLKLVNEEVTTDSGHGSLSEGVAPRIIVSNLTASWTHVSYLY